MIKKIKQLLTMRRDLDQTRSSLENRKKDIYKLQKQLKQTKDSLTNRKEEIYKLRAQALLDQKQRKGQRELFQDKNALMLDFTKKMIKNKQKLFARSLAQTLYRYGDKEIGTITWAHQAYQDGFSALCYQLLTKIDQEHALRYVPVEFTTTLIENNYEKFNNERSDILALLDTSSKFIVAQKLYEIKETLASYELLKELDQSEVDDKTATRLQWMREKLHQKIYPEIEKETTDTPRIAILDYKNIEYDKTSANLGDYTQTLAVMSNMARFSNIQYKGELSSFLNNLKDEVDPSNKKEDVTGEIEISIVNRDFSSSKTHHKKTWLFGFGWYMHSSFNVFDFPFSDNILPLFISFHVNRPEMLDDTAINYLKKYAPIGCRDWSTVYLLNSLDVDCFFSGCVTTTMSNIFPHKNVAANNKIAIVDANYAEGEDFRNATISENLKKSYEKFKKFQQYNSIRTSRLHSYLPSRSIGLEVEFIPKNPADIRFDGLAPIDDTEFNTIRDGIKHKISETLSLIYKSATEAEVYSRWNELCKDEVAHAKKVCNDVEPTPISKLDLDQVIERSKQNFVYFNSNQDVENKVKLAFAFDIKLHEIFPTVLESIIDNTNSNLQIYILARKIEMHFFNTLAEKYLNVEFVIVDLTTLDYGDNLRLLSHISESTMDRLLLPDLLPNEDKILYLDVDLLVLGDISELYHTELGDYPLAGRSSKFLSWKYVSQMIYRASLHLPYKDARYLRKYASKLQNILVNGYNAGVLVLNLAKMREDNFTHRFIPLIEQYKLNDQDALNLYTGMNRFQLDNEWNCVPSQDMLKNPKIIHWAGPAKPWLSDYIPYKEQFMYYKNKSLTRATQSE